MRTGLSKQCVWSSVSKLALLSYFMFSVVSANAAPIPHPDFTTDIVNPADVVKYVNPLPNAYQLRVAPDTAAYQGEDYYRIDIGQFYHDMGLRLLPSATGYSLAAGNPKRIRATPSWGYGYIAPGSPAGAKGAYSFPGPTIVNSTGRPTRVTWTNSLPDKHLIGIDPTLHCGDNAPNCSPENRTVVHVHGAHVWDDSDGSPLSWFSNGFSKTGETWKANSQYGPVGTYRYINDQEAGTVWYHDHAVGQTHSNVYAGLAGFFLVTDDNEKALQSYTPGATAPVLPSYAPGAPYEIPIALQDRIFYPDGRLALPDNPVLDITATVGPGIACGQGGEPAFACTVENPSFLPPNMLCDTLSQVNDYMCPAMKFSKAADGSLIPYTGSGPAFSAPSITPEFFGNISLANGKVWPKQDIEPRKYRLRLLNGNDSRTYFLKFNRTGLPVWQIGTDQGFLNNPVDRTDSFIILMPGERIDLIVDFAGVPDATQILLQNFAHYDAVTGFDIPYDGTPPAQTGQPVNGIIPDVLRFDVTIPFNASVPEATVSLSTSLRPVPIAPLTATANVPARQLSLVERTDALGRLTLTLDGREYMDANLPVSELPALGDTEIWEIANYTPDAHPIHLHQVRFQLINRDQITWNQQALGVQVEPVIPYVAPPSYTVVPNTTTLPDPWEAGWKDTLQMLPGTVNRIIATFDLPGLYVWHCHILSHEESDMMRPFIVTTPVSSVSASLTRNGAALGSGEPAATVTPLRISAVGRTGLGGGKPEFSGGFEYRFTITGPNGYSQVRPYTDWMNPARDYYDWTPPINNPGAYQILVEARQVGSTVNDQASTALAYNLTAPSVASATSTSTDGSYTVGGNINITLNFSQTISSAGLIISLNSGAVLNTGAITNTSSFSGVYTVSGGESTADLSITSISGTISDGTNSTLNPAVPAGFNIADSKAIAVVTSFTLSYAAGANGTLSGITPQSAVAYGASGSAVTPVADTGYHFVQWSDASTANPRTDSNVTADLNVTAQFAINSYSLTYSAGANGVISGNTLQNVNHGAIGSQVTAIPALNYHFVSWSDGVLTASRTDANVTGAVNVTASFAINSFTLNYSAGANGFIVGTSPQPVFHGGSGTSVSAVPSPNYHFVQWSDGSTANPRTDSNVTADLNVTAQFAINSYALIYTAGANGVISGNTLQEVNHGASGSQVTAIPALNYHFVSWSDGVLTASRTDANVTGAINVTASFAINSFTLNYFAGANGSITGAASQTVNYGGSGTAVTAVAASNYHFVQWSDGSTANPRMDSNVTADLNVTAQFAINSYTLIYAAGANGALSGSTLQNVSHGASGSQVTAIPALNYHFVSWSDGVLAASRTDANVTGAINVTATFAINSFTLNYSAGANGSITGAASQTVNYGGSGTAVTAVAAPNYHFVQWSDGSTANPRTDLNVAAGVSVSAVFTIDMYTVVFTSSQGGTVTGTIEQLVPHGGSASLVNAAVTDPAAYHFVNWIENGLVVSSQSALTLSNITSNRQIVANFSDSYVVTPVAGSNGSITPALPENVNQGFNTVYVVTPAAQYRVASVQGCGGTLSGNTFVTAAINADCKIIFNFAPLTGQPLVHNGVTGHDLLQAAYDSALPAAVIKSQVNTFAEDLLFNKTVNVSIKGGFDSALNTQVGMTTVRGQLVVQSGQVTLDRIVVW